MIPTSKTTGDPETGPFLEGGLFRAVQGLVALLLVARWLIPPESAVLGDTLWIAVSWLGAVLLWGWDAFRRRDFRVRADMLDLAVGVLVLGHVISTFPVLAGEGNQRAALNLMWEWIGLGTSFFLLRQTLRTPEDSQHLQGILVSAAVTLAAYGIWQHYVDFPELVARYEKLNSDLEALSSNSAGVSREDVQQIRREIHRLGVPQDPASRMLWVNRLQSTEPFATFALANTLAGFLAAWLFVLADAGRNAVANARGQSLWSKKHLAIAAGLVLLAYCLILTKSRTAWAGIVAGGLVWGGLSLPRNQKTLGRGLLILAAIGVVVLLLFTVAALSGGLDEEVLSESPKSLEYRMQYWTGSAAVVKENVWLGTGPGNFRAHYLKHKLPGSSEEIADPHNWILDLWANGGLMALAGFVLFLVLILRAGRRAQTQAESETRPAKGICVWEIGAAFAFPAVGLVGWMSGEPVTIRLIALLVAGAAVRWLLGCVDWNRFRSPGLLAGGTALLVHLLGAGGIEMPAIVQILVIFAAILSLRFPENENAAFAPNRPILVPAMTLAAVPLILLCVMTALRPVWYASVYLSAGDAVLQTEGNFAAAAKFYEQARESDPRSPEPYYRLADLFFQRYRAGGGEANFGRAVSFAKGAIQRDPASYQGYRRLGLWYLDRANAAQDAKSESLSAQYLSEAVARYPNSAGLRGEYALALAKAGRPAEAQKQAERALSLDQINRDAGHQDKYLGEEFVNDLEKLAD